MSNNKLIAKNTLLLYFRMLIMLFIALLTSRLVINILGIDDFGIYNVVGGVVILVSFLNRAMTNVTQRFYSYYLGKGDKKELEKIFNTCLLCCIIISLVIVILLETIGLWFVTTQLNIPPERLNAAIIVFHFSVLTLVLNLICVPFASMIVSHENMSIYAYVSIGEAFLKLVIIFLLKLSPAYQLELYSFFLSIVPLFLLLIYWWYCKTRYVYCRIHKIKDFSLIRNVLSYSSWSMLGGGANVGVQQGGNFLINIYSGIAANASYGIANQLSHAISLFVNNFQTAFNPQIIKLYAKNEIKELNVLILRASLFSYYLMWILSLPMIINIDYVLSLWLGNVPLYANVFSILMIIYYLIDSIQAPLFMTIYASGKIRNYQLWLSLLLVLNIPISYICLELGYAVSIILGIRVLINFISAIIRTWYMKSFIKFEIEKYLKSIITKIVPVSVITLFIAFLIKNISDSNFLSFVLNSFLIIVITCVAVYWLGLNNNERYLIRSFASKFIISRINSMLRKR